MKGVIANESPASWPQAALRAQAVAARSYALSVQVDGNGFDLYDDTSSQVYEGLASETPRPTGRRRRPGARWSSTAAKSRRHSSPPARAATPRASRTSSSEQPVPYLVGVPDPYDGYCPLHRWTLRFSGRRDQRQAGRLPRRQAEEGRGRSKRGVLAPDRLGQPLRDRRHDHASAADRLASALGAYDSWMTFRKVVGGKVVPSGETGPPAGGGGGGGAPPGGTAVEIGD